MTRIHILVVLAAMAAGTPAHAQDIQASAGPRVEASVGLDQLRFDLASIGGDGRAKQADLGYGVALGYDVPVSPTLLVGVEGGVNLSDVHASTGTAATGGTLRQRRELTLAGRLSTPLADNLLLYGKIGYANLQLRESQTADGTTASAARDLDGVLLGTGIEVKLTPKAYWKSEYRYTDYADGHVSNKVTTGIGLRF